MVVENHGDEIFIGFSSDWFSLYKNNDRDMREIKAIHLNF